MTDRHWPAQFRRGRANVRCLRAARLTAGHQPAHLYGGRCATMVAAHRAGSLGLGGDQLVVGREQLHGARPAARQSVWPTSRTGAEQ
jgi:hypothetical protein